MDEAGKDSMDGERVVCSIDRGKTLWMEKNLNE